MKMPTQNCSICGKQFARSDSLKRHVKKFHSDSFSEVYKPGQKPFKCRVCDKYFARQDNLKTHVKTIHKEKFHHLYPDKPFKFSCAHCNQLFNTEYGLKSHCKSSHIPVHKQKKREINSQKLCPICKIGVPEEKFLGMKSMIYHLKNVHYISIQSKELRFPSVSEFNNWKTSVEEENKTQYKKYSTKSNRSHVFITYICSRSGFYKPKGQRIRKIKWQGSKKIGAYCPSSIRLKINSDGSCTAEFIGRHVGHNSDYAHMTPSNPEKDFIAKAVAEKIPFNHIFDGIRTSVPISRKLCSFSGDLGKLDVKKDKLDN